MLTDLAITVAIVFFILFLWIGASTLLGQFQYRRLLKVRGMTFDALQRTSPDDGTIIIDYVFGRAAGIGNIVIWWTAKLNDRDAYYDHMRWTPFFVPRNALYL